MKSFIFLFCISALTGCGAIQHADKQAGLSYREGVRQSNQTAMAKAAGSDAVRMEAVRAAQTTTVHRPEPDTSCPDLSAQEEGFKRLCEDHTEGSGDVNIDREEVCVSLRSALDSLRDRCGTDDNGEQGRVIFAPPEPPGAGVNINLTGASTGDIRFIIQSPGAADQSSNAVGGADDTPPHPPESVITGMSIGLLDYLSEATPWAIGGAALGKFAEAFGDGLRNAGDRDRSIDNSVDHSIGGDYNNNPAEDIEALADESVD